MPVPLPRAPAGTIDSANVAIRVVALSDSSASAISTVNPTVSGRKWAGIAAAIVLIAVATALISWWRQPLPIPVVEAVTQLTDDGEPKRIYSNLLTDGSRIYFNEGTAFSMKIGQVAVTGGPTAIIPTRLAIPQIVGVDPEGSSLLAIIGSPSEDILPLWTIPLPIGEPRRLGNLKAQDASFCPDGRILFSQGKDLYLAEKEGSNPHKLLTADGLIGEPSMSPDGTQIVFTSYPLSGLATIFAAKADGSVVHPIATANEGLGYCCALWMPDGRYIVFQNRGASRRDLWMWPMKAGFLQRSRQLIQLTAGPLSYSGPVASRDGKQIFAAGTKQRGELVRYDGNSKQFVPFLSGISAFNPTFSRDGKWVAYASYPDHSLWRSRSDGTDRLQLTFPPVRVQYPFISADGKSVAFGTSEAEIYVISTEGGSPQKVAEKRAFAASWSPDGNLLVYADYSDALHTKFQLLDLRTGNRSVVPGSQDLIGVQWVAENMLVATTRDHSKVLMFDVKTQQWSDLVPGPVPGDVVNWAHSPDCKYVYYTTRGRRTTGFARPTGRS